MSLSESVSENLKSLFSVSKKMVENGKNENLVNIFLVVLGLSRVKLRFLFQIFSSVMSIFLLLFSRQPNITLKRKIYNRRRTLSNLLDFDALLRI